MRQDQEDRISAAFTSYARSWGPVRWRDRITSVEVSEDVPFARMLHALGAIESDSVVMRRKVHAIRADRSNPIGQFNVLWLAEEAEHGFALTALAERLGFRTDTAPERRHTRNVRAALTWPSLYVAGVLMPHMEAAYCTLGTLQEYIALTTYRRIGERLGDEAVSRILRDIAVQESHHMRFYRTAAAVLLEDPAARRTTRVLMDRLWRPPGVDLLGISRWTTVFAPLLHDRTYVSRLLRMDDLLAGLVGAGGGRGPARRFFAEHAPTATTSEESQDERKSHAELLRG